VSPDGKRAFGARPAATRQISDRRSRSSRSAPRRTAARTAPGPPDGRLDEIADARRESPPASRVILR